MKTTKRAKPFGSPCSALQRLRQIAFNAATAGMRNPERNRGEDPPMWDGSARSQGQRQSTRLRGVMDDVLSVRYRRSHAVQGQPRHQNERYRGQQGNELSERRCRRALQDNGYPTRRRNVLATMSQSFQLSVSRMSF